jgi:hypothetical protein
MKDLAIKAQMVALAFYTVSVSVAIALVMYTK